MPADVEPDRGPRILKQRFRLLSQLAKGGMGVTHRAWDEHTGRPVVVKMPKRALFDEPGFLERFDREVRATAGLDHPFIVAVVDHGVDGGEPFLAMRFLPGGSLASRVALHAERGRERLPMAQLHAWLPRIAAALDHAHASGVLHRDVKPANIFFDALGQACLGDFGIAKIVEDSAADAADSTLTHTHMTIGTGAYMAPERLKPRAAIDGRSDQYSLAICVFEALAGIQPFRGERENIFVEQATFPPPDLAKLRPDITPACRHAVSKALAKRPSERFATCGEFAAAVLEGAPAPDQATGLAWLECPACRKLIRLPQSAAGREGRCPRCRATLVIAHDLEGLWLPDEYGPIAGEPARSAASEHAPPARPWQRVSPRARVAIAVAIAALLVPLAIVTPPSPTPPQGSLTPPEPDPPPSRDQPSEDAAAELPAQDPPPQDLPAVTMPDETIPAMTPASEPALADAAASAASLPTPPPATPAPADLATTQPDDPPAIRKADEEWPARRDAANAHFNETVQWVLVDDPGNPPADPATRRGAVDEPFYLAQYELTNADYCMFLNASAAGIDNEAGIGDRAIAPPDSIPGIGREMRGLGLGYRYMPLPNMEDKPAVLDVFDAIALVNWLHNVHATGEDVVAGGVYAASSSAAVPARADRQPAALFFIPTIDEWFKAAYFKGGKRSPGYHRYPTATSKPLVAVSGPLPDGRPSLRGVETTANFAGKAVWAGMPPEAAPTGVGMNGAPSPFGAFDMGGNVAEWAIADHGGRGLAVACGGDFHSPLKSLDRAMFDILDPLVPPPAPVVTGLRLARSIESARMLARPLAADPYQRMLKDDTFATLKKFDAAIKALLADRQPGAWELSFFSPAHVQLVLKKHQLPNFKQPSADPEAATALADFTSHLQAAEKVLQQRHNELMRLFQQAAMKPPPGNDLLWQELVKFAVGLKMQQDLADIKERYDAQLAPIQRHLFADFARSATLRETLTQRYGDSRP